MPFVPCRTCLVINSSGSGRCHACGCECPCGEGRTRPRHRRVPALLFLLSLGPLLACGSGGDPAARQRYEADRQKCESLSTDPGARKSCMVYRGWPDGKFK